MTVILLDYEFSLMTYYLAVQQHFVTGIVSIGEDGTMKCNGPAKADPVAYVESCERLGYMQVGPCVVCSEGAAMSEIRKQRTAGCAAGMN